MITTMPRYASIFDLLPHRGPMRFLDEVIEFNGLQVVCRGIIRADNPFLENRHLPNWVAIEYLAQTAGVLHALLHPEPAIKPERPPIAYLVLTKHVQLSDYFPSVGEGINIAVQQESSHQHFFSVRGEVRSADHWIGQGEVTLAMASHHP